MAGPELKRLGRYTIESTLGQGAMGVVYGATDSTLHRKVAIKTILKSALDPETARQYSMRFMREAQAVARLNHPNIVQVHDFGEEGDVAYIVMEFINGKELQDYFDTNRRFEAREAVRIMGELCDALQFAHEAGIIHRDVKPANVMIDAQGRVKLADFGVARITDADRTLTERTQAGTMIGTPAYMSPEQISGGQVDHRSDIFSAGIILYQFLTGERAFVGEGAWTIAKKIMQDHPPPPSSIDSRISPVFDRVANKALAKNAKERYQNARDLAGALRLALEGKTREDEAGKAASAAPAEAPKKAVPAPQVVPTNPGTQEVELEFWRAIKDGNDPEDFDLYVQQFPSGIYADLARRKIAKLRGTSIEEDTQKMAALEKKALEEAARREADARAKLAGEKAQLEARLAEEKARLEAELARKEGELRKREADAEARRQAEAKARADEVARAKQQAEALVAKQAADERARRAAEENARKAAEARAKYEAAERAKREADLAKREAELTQRMASAPAKRSFLVPAIVAAAAVVAAVGAGLFAWNRSDSSADAKRMAELVAQLDQYKQREAELKQSREQGARLDEEAAQARQREAEMQKQAEAMRQREEEAKKAGDLAKQRELAALAAQREAEAKKQAELTRQREAEAKKQAELTRQREAEAKKQAETAKQQQAELARLEAEKRRQADSSRAADKAAQAKAAAEKAAAEKAAAEKATEATRKAAAQKQAEAERLAKLETERQSQAAAAAAVEQRAAAEKAAAEKAAAEKAAAEKAAAEKAKLASAAPAASAGGAEALYNQAAALENDKKYAEAVRAYIQAARAGSGQAAKKLGDLYGKGAPGVTIDSTESIKWYNFARLRGVDVGSAGR